MIASLRPESRSIDSRWRQIRSRSAGPRGRRSMCRSLARAIGARGVTGQVFRVEVDRAEIAAGIAFGLVIEMGRGRIAALPAGADRPGAQAGTEFDDGDEAVAAGAVPAPRAGISARAERSERAPAGGGEGHG